MKQPKNMNPRCRNFILVVFILSAMLSNGMPLDAAQVGIKYNRSKWEYPKPALSDFKRFSEDRIRTVMICLPWGQWEPAEGKVDEYFISKRLAPVLRFCEKHKISVILSNHCSYWSAKGNWSMPDWLLQKPGFESATSALTVASIRAHQISFLNRWIDATRSYPCIAGYNILNEPVSATKRYFKFARGEFDQRWEGTYEIVKAVWEHLREIRAPQFLIIGNASCDVGFERYMWENTGKMDLTVLWNNYLDPVAAQNLQMLMAACPWYPGRAKIRTEVAFNFKLLEAARKVDFDYAKIRTQWSPTADHTPALYDYDAVYDYEGLATAAVPDLKSFYVWRVGSSNGSADELLLFDHRHADRPTPYYWALRDLASGIDSFETLDAASLPKNGKENLALDPQKTKPGISKRWNGSGTIVGQKKDIAWGTGSTIAARLILEPGQSMLHSVIPVHWRDSGVTAADGLVFQAKLIQGGELTLVARQGDKEFRCPVRIKAKRWKGYRVSFKDLGIREGDIGFLEQVGFANESDEKQVIFLDDFLIH
ncbi:MAG: hypothetical protein PHN49_04855 [Candidatus Omnitrophica bacterium]|nr:hypothetical protein [Candidatus Omnitrophota bacterium]MDD5670950.1 hypothetical protein [Candidatus Omnitrophota bacterium]